MKYFRLNLTICSAVLMFIASLLISPLSYAHSPDIKAASDSQGKLTLNPIARTENKLLPKTLYKQTMGHQFKRRFYYANTRVKHVYLDHSSSTNRLYAKVIPKRTVQKHQNSYWP